MAPLIVTLMGLAWSASVATAGSADGLKHAGVGSMGPAAFMWPPDRVWSADMDNNAPCGSVATVSNRTKYPLQGGKVALVAQEDSFDIQLAISFVAEPKYDGDFRMIKDASAFRELDPGHTCIGIPDPPPETKSGQVATLQIKYTSKFDHPGNETFYACADIEYVPATEIRESNKCFNATVPDDDDEDDSDKGKPVGSGGSANDGNRGSNGASSSTSSEAAVNNPSGKTGLSGGAIAGIVIGCVFAVGLLGAIGLLLIYRRRQQRLNMLRQQHSARGVKWDSERRGSHTNQSESSVKMQNL